MYLINCNTCELIDNNAVVYTTVMCCEVFWPEDVCLWLKHVAEKDTTDNIVALMTIYFILYWLTCCRMCSSSLWLHMKGQVYEG